MTEYGLQMYSVRDITKESLKDALRQVAEMGYKYVEFAGFFGNTAEDVKSWLDEYGLKCSGTHTKGDMITPDAIKETIAYHKTIGCTKLIVPSARWKTPEEMEYYIALFNYAQKKLAAEGIDLGYHNHSGEFYPTPYGKIVDTDRLAHVENEDLPALGVCSRLKNQGYGLFGGHEIADNLLVRNRNGAAFFDLLQKKRKHGAA